MLCPTYISISRKPLPLKPLPSSPKAAPFYRRLILLPCLAFWALLTIYQLIVPLPVSCSPHLRHPWPGPTEQQPPVDEFWQWAHSGDAAQGAPCIDAGGGSRGPAPNSGRYMVVVVSGGLNQQRNQIIDAVVVARILEAVLVLPVFQVNQVWGDDSEFGDIFDAGHFRKTLKEDVVVVSSLPAMYMRGRRVSAPAMPFNADEDWIRRNYSSKFDRYPILVLRAFDSRLAKNLSVDLQKLRCKVAFEALRFKPWILVMADNLVQKMEEEGPYLALHLRLEKDVWVRTGCPSGLGGKADRAIEQERLSKPQLLTSRTKLTARQRYLAGLCPLSADEISRLLKGVGAPKNTRIYWAGGQPFGGQKALQPLKKQYPNLFNKWDLAKPGVLDVMKSKPSVMAALDYIVCLKSKVFLASHGGNMARSLQGHRTFIGSGKQIKPNKKLLVKLFRNQTLSEAEIGNQIRQIHVERIQRTKEAKPKIDVVAFPEQHCMCRRAKNASITIGELVYSTKL